MKTKIRPLYSELQGYLYQAPNNDDWIHEETFTKQYNGTINSLSTITDKDYSGYRIYLDHNNNDGIRAIVYKQKLGGLIARLHGEYFSDEPAPFGGMPSTVITTTQMQSQSVDIQMLLTIQSKIDEQLPKFEEGSKEKNFLQKLKGSLSGVKDATQLLSQLVIVAKDLGISVADLYNIFH